MDSATKPNIFILPAILKMDLYMQYNCQKIATNIANNKQVLKKQQQKEITSYHLVFYNKFTLLLQVLAQQ